MDKQDMVRFWFVPDYLYWNNSQAVYRHDIDYITHPIQTLTPCYLIVAWWHHMVS